MNENEIIYFYDEHGKRTRKEHYFLNTYDPSPFIADDKLSYPTVEHYFQAQKFADFDISPDFKEIFEEIRNLKSPADTKEIANKYRKSHPKFDSEKWAKIKVNVMKKAQIFKFSQNKDLLDRLVLTGKAKLVEESEEDLFWGGLLEGSKNMLGVIMMELRDNYVKSNDIYVEGSGLERIKI